MNKQDGFARKAPGGLCDQAETDGSANTVQGGIICRGNRITGNTGTISQKVAPANCVHM